MKAVQFTGHGGREVVEYGDAPDPEPGREEVLVDVKAGALNHLDVHTRRGVPGVDLSFPHVPGSDGAGEVLDVGAAVERFEPGDRVAVSASVWCGRCEFCRRGEFTRCVRFRVLGEHLPGVHAELAAVPEENLVAVPDGVEWSTAAAAPLVFGTAWRALHTRGDLSAGERVLVLGASGGVGHACVQIAAHAGCTVYATAGSEEKRAHALSLGADRAVDYTDGDFAARVRELTGKRGVDVVVDHVGAATWPDSLRALAKGGRAVVPGATTGPRAETDLGRVFWNELDARGSTMFAPGELDAVLERVWDGTFAVEVCAELPMSETARGHDLLENRQGFGKVVVIPDSERTD